MQIHHIFTHFASATRHCTRGMRIGLGRRGQWTFGISPYFSALYMYSLLIYCTAAKAQHLLRLLPPSAMASFAHNVDQLLLHLFKINFPALISCDFFKPPCSILSASQAWLYPQKHSVIRNDQYNTSDLFCPVLSPSIPCAIPSCRRIYAIEERWLSLCLEKDIGDGKLHFANHCR